MFLLIDNYDSFTYNLVQAFYQLGKKPVLVKNDDPELLRMVNSPDLEMVCISPGPGHPDSAGLCSRFLRELNPEIPVLGVCLGHQLLAQHAGAEVRVGPAIMHGKDSRIIHDGKGIFKNLPNPLTVGRYHSLVAYPDEEVEQKFTVTARGPLGEIMAIQYKDRPWVGVQFHPESILTPEGLELLGNFPGELMPKAHERTPISLILGRLARKEDLTPEMAESAFSALLDGDLSPAQAGALLMGLSAKGEQPLELAHARRAALGRSVQVKGVQGKTIDIVGTGGDCKNSFNCSTASALILAGMGYKVIKHGNRAVSSKCGSADALEHLGIPMESDPAKALARLEKSNFTFLFAPYYHPSFKNIGPVRKELGIPTLFNLLGPMINPARPSHLLMGVAKNELVPLISQTLSHAGLHCAAIFCGAGGYDELTPIGQTEVTIMKDGKISRLTVNPADFGISPCKPSELAVNSLQEAIEVLKNILKGNGPRAMMDMVILNVGLAIYLLEENIPLEAAMSKAREGVYGSAGQKVVGNA